MINGVVWNLRDLRPAKKNPRQSNTNWLKAFAKIVKSVVP